MTAGPWGLNWAGEFREPQRELVFRGGIWAHTSRQARLFALWGSLVFFLSSIANYLVAGFSAYFYAMVAARFMVLLVAWWPYRAAGKPEYSRQVELALTALCCLAALVQSYGVYAWPRGTQLPFYGVLGMSVVFWLFVPVGMLWKVIQNLVLDITFLAAYILGGHDTISAHFYTALTALTVINILGFYTVRQLNASRRSQYADNIRTSEAEENYRQVIDNANEGILVVQDHRVVFANPIIYRMSGYTPQQLIGSSVEHYLAPAERDTLVEYGRRRTEGGKVPAVYQTKLRVSGDRWVWVEVSGVVIKWQGSTAVLYFLADISQRLKAQAEEKEMAKLQGVMEMAGAACHEINQPLQVLATLAELAKVELPADSPVQNRLTAMQESLERLRQLTLKIQRVSRYETMDYLEKTRIIDIDKASQEDERD